MIISDIIDSLQCEIGAISEEIQAIEEQLVLGDDANLQDKLKECYIKIAQVYLDYEWTVNALEKKLKIANADPSCYPESVQKIIESRLEAMYRSYKAKQTEYDQDQIKEIIDIFQVMLHYGDTAKKETAAIVPVIIEVPAKKVETPNNQFKVGSVYNLPSFYGQSKFHKIFITKREGNFIWVCHIFKMQPENTETKCRVKQEKCIKRIVKESVYVPGGSGIEHESADECLDFPEDLKRQLMARYNLLESAESSLVTA